MEHSPSGEGNNSTDSQEILSIFLGPEGSSPHTQEPRACPYPGPSIQMLPPTILFLEDPF